MSIYTDCEPYFEDIHPVAADGTTTVDVLELVGDCPIPRGQAKNELGVGCDECLAETPDRAGLCSAWQSGWFAISPEEVVYFGTREPDGIVGYELKV